MTQKKVLALVALAATLSAASLFAATKSYQVTGSVIEVTADKIVVDKKGEKFEIARDASSKVTAEPKVGEKVTVEYRMTATSIETKTEMKKDAKKK